MAIAELNSSVLKGLDWKPCGYKYHTVSAFVCKNGDSVYDKMEDVFYTAKSDDLKIVFPNGEEKVMAKNNFVSLYTSAGNNHGCPKDATEENAPTKFNWFCACVPVGQSYTVPNKSIIVNNPKVNTHVDGDYVLCKSKDNKPDYTSFDIINGSLFDCIFEKEEKGTDSKFYYFGYFLNAYGNDQDIDLIKSIIKTYQASYVLYSDHRTLESVNISKFKKSLENYGVDAISKLDTLQAKNDNVTRVLSKKMMYRLLSDMLFVMYLTRKSERGNLSAEECYLCLKQEFKGKNLKAQYGSTINNLYSRVSNASTDSEINVEQHYKKICNALKESFETDNEVDLQLHRQELIDTYKLIRVFLQYSNLYHSITPNKKSIFDLLDSSSTLFTMKKSLPVPMEAKKLQEYSVKGNLDNLYVYLNACCEIIQQIYDKLSNNSIIQNIITTKIKASNTPIGTIKYKDNITTYEYLNYFNPNEINIDNNTTLISVLESYLDLVTVLLFK